MAATHLPEGLRPSSLIRVFVPSADRFGRLLNSRSLLRSVLHLVLTFTSGATIYRGTGFWYAADGNLIHERVWIVESYVFPGMDADTLGRFLAGLVELAHEFDQEAWLVALDGAPLLLAGSNGASGATGDQSPTLGLLHRNGGGQ